MATRKQERLQRELQRRIAAFIQLELKDPRLAVPHAVTDAQISADLRVLKLYVSVDAPAEQQQIVLGVLKGAARRMRHQLGEELELRVLPELRFYLDDTPERAHRIDEILDSLHED